MASDPNTSLQPDCPERDDSAQDDRRVVDTQGGDYAEGSIDKRQGTFVEGNLVVTEELAYKVSGLPNPYLGLRAFTAAERDIFAGREHIVRALVDRLSADDGDRLLFIVGASGSGKSSLARAGLLPELEDRLKSKGVKVQTQIVNHPSREPVSTLVSLLQPEAASADGKGLPLLLLLIDQFEEFFSQVDQDERNRAFLLLTAVAGHAHPPVRIIATMRSDFLPQLVADVRFEPYERRKVVLRAMTPDELHEAIQRPIQVRYAVKRFEPALVKRLAQDAATNVAYLPLLQVTLEDMWRGGALRLSAYYGLANAIQRRADAVYSLRDYDGLHQEPRPPDEQAALLALLLDLVRVAPGTDVSEVRWERSRTEVTCGDPLRERLIDDLATARLLRTDRVEESESETVELIHEALLTGWSRLKAAIDAERDHLRRRERFLLAMDEWRSSGQNDDYLLSGVRLAEAEALQQHNDSVLQRVDAALFMQRSLQRRTDEQQQALAQAQALATAAEARTAAETRARKEAEARTIEQRNANTRIRRRSQWVAAVALIALLFAGATAFQTNTAEQRMRVAVSRQLVDQAKTLSADRLDLALLLGASAVKVYESTESYSALLAALQSQKLPTKYLEGNEGSMNIVAIDPSRNILASGGDSGLIVLHDLASGRRLGTLTGDGNRISDLAFHPSGDILVSSSCRKLGVTNSCDEGDIRLWDINSQQQIGLPLVGYKGGIKGVTFSSDGTILASAGCADPDLELARVPCSQGEIRLWDVRSGTLLLPPLVGHSSWANDVTFRSDDRIVASVSWDGSVILWDVASGEPISSTFHIPLPYMKSVFFSSDGSKILSGDSERIFWWDYAANKTVEPEIVKIKDDIRSIAMNAKESILAIGFDDKTIEIYNLTTGQQLFSTIIGHPLAAQDLDLSQDGVTLVAGNGNGSLVVYELAERTSLGRYLGMHLGGVTEVKFGNDGNTIVSIGQDNLISIWDTQEYDLIKSISVSESELLAADTDPESEDLIVVTGNSVVRYNEQNDETIFFPLNISMSIVNDIAIASDSKEIVVGGGYGLASSIEIYEAGTGNIVDTELVEIQNYVTPINVVAVSSDGLLVAAGRQEGLISLWELTNQRSEELFIDTQAGSVLSLAISPDNKVLASSGSNGTIQLWDLVTGKLIGAPLTGLTTPTYSLAFHPNGKILAAGSSNGSIWLWDLDSMRQIGQLEQGHTEHVVTLAFSPDGNSLASGGVDGNVFIWHTKFADWVEYACIIANRNMSRSEWVQYVGEAIPYQEICTNIP